MAWDRAVTLSDKHPHTTRAYQAWKRNIIHKHMKDYHSGMPLPFNLWSLNAIKKESPNRDEVHQYSEYVPS